MSHRRVVLAAALACPVVVGAQASPRPAPTWLAEYQTGGELESYLRALQLAGAAPPVPWSLRGLSPGQIERAAPADTTAHPWAGRFAHDTARRDLRWQRALVGTRWNSSLPWGMNDGAVWAGRGVTAWASGGMLARYGPLSARVAPLAFVAQNAGFAIADNGREGKLRFEHPDWPGRVDLPQRFGTRPYAVLDPGESSVRLDVRSLGLSFGTEHEWWGPAQEYPTVLGTNAAGFPHVALGTTHPVNLWIARAHTRVIWGRLDQSAYFQAEGADASLVRARRFATGAILQIQPRGLDGLELGVQRFFHAPYPDHGLPRRYLTRVLEVPFKSKLRFTDGSIPTDGQSIDGENQVAAAYARLAMPRAGFEMYMELGREDHSHDLRDLTINPTDRGSTLFGFAKVWRAADGTGLRRLRAEAINFQSVQEEMYRGPGAFYIHSSGSNQGHTQRGQLLGAGVGVSSAAGATVALDRFDRDGRWTATWSRVVRRDRGNPYGSDTTIARALDVVHTLGAERLVFRGAVEATAGAYIQREFNRDFGRDRWNLGATFSVRGLP